MDSKHKGCRELSQEENDLIKGYRSFSQEEFDLIHEGNALAEQCGRYIDKLLELESTDKRSVELGKNNLQQGFMWTIRSIAKPEIF